MAVLGLDLGNNHFRAVELTSEKGKTILKRFGTLEKPELNLFSDANDDLKAYSDAIR